MKISVRNHLSPFTAILTVTIGIASVSAANIFTSSFQARVSEQSVGSSSTISDRGRPERLELSCYDLSVLPIWSELKRDVAFEERRRLMTGSLDCSEIVQVSKSDLN